MGIGRILREKRMMTSPDRRRILLSVAAAAVLSLPDGPAFAQSAGTGSKFAYRGFTVDASAVQDLPNINAIEGSLKHQIDIVADCGASAAILAFFKSQEIVVKPGQGDGGGHFSSNSQGVTVDAAVQAPEKPVILHELLHAYHFRVLPGRIGKTPTCCASITLPGRANSIRGLLCPEERAGVFRGDGKPLSLGQRRPSAAQP